MDHREHTCYEVRLNRLFNLQSRQNLIWLLVSILLPAGFTTIHSFTDGTVDLQAAVIYYGISLILMTVKLCSYPKRLYVTPDTVRLQYRGALLALLVRGQIWIGTNQQSKYEETYTLYHIKSITYLQTPLEKRFSCGHVQICGDVNAGEGKEPRTFTVYGVRDFENTSDWMKGYVKLYEDT